MILRWLLRRLVRRWSFSRSWWATMAREQSRTDWHGVSAKRPYDQFERGPKNPKKQA